MPDQKTLTNSALVALSIFILTGCSNPLEIVQPLDISKANKSSTASFTVHKKGSYRFALLFVRASTRMQREHQTHIFGDANEEGVPIKVNLQLTRDGSLFLDQEVETVGVEWGQRFIYQNRDINTAIRSIRIIELPTGHYTAEVKTLHNTDEFSEVESYAGFTSFNPKH